MNFPKFTNFHLGLFALLAYLIFAGIESLFCIFFIGKYQPYYILSIVVWIGICLLFYFPLFGIKHLIEKISLKFKSLQKNNFKNLFFPALFSLAPLFCYTSILTVENLPGKFYSISNIIIVIIIFIIFSLILFYLYNSFKNKLKNSVLSSYFFITIFSGFSSISGILLVQSELQSEHWLGSLFFIILLCILMPFFFIVILKHLHRFSKIFLLIGLIIFLLITELKIFCPGRDRFFFDQAINDNISTKYLSKQNSPNIILIVMDTTRAINMSLYGYNKLTTPNLDKFAKESTVFKNAISSAPWTLPSHASLFTGCYSYIHGATHGKTKKSHGLPLLEKYNTLAELLSKYGYITGAVTANTAYLGPWTKLNQGFNFYWWGRPRNKALLLPIIFSKIFSSDSFIFNILGITSVVSAKRINQIALKFLKRVIKTKEDSPWFLFINYMEAHGTNYLPSPYSKLFTTPPRPKRNKKEFKNIHCWYDNEIASLDNEIGLLFSSLKEIGLYEGTFIIVTADHGELLGEHNDFYGHEFWLYQELLHVPLIIKYPFGKKSGVMVHKMVQNIDIFAELTSYVGINIPSYIQGQPFIELDHPIISEVKGLPKHTNEIYRCDLVAIYPKELSEFKLIRSTSGYKKLYNLKVDPKELNNIYDPQKLKIIKKELDTYFDYLDKVETVKHTHKPDELDEATKERLRSLGYINK